jgi:hypothetical protein
MLKKVPGVNNLGRLIETGICHELGNKTSLFSPRFAVLMNTHIVSPAAPIAEGVNSTQEGKYEIYSQILKHDRTGPNKLTRLAWDEENQTNDLPARINACSSIKQISGGFERVKNKN